MSPSFHTFSPFSPDLAKLMLRAAYFCVRVHGMGPSATVAGRVPVREMVSVRRGCAKLLPLMGKKLCGVTINASWFVVLFSQLLLKQLS